VIEVRSLTQRNIVTGIVVASLLAACAVALLILVNNSSSETAEGGAAQAGPAPASWLSHTAQFSTTPRATPSSTPLPALSRTSALPSLLIMSKAIRRSCLMVLPPAPRLWRLV